MCYNNNDLLVWRSTDWYEVFVMERTGMYEFGNELLTILLQDHSSDKNIIWATANYEYLGIGYQPDSPITADAVAGENGGVIKPRTEKTKTEQTGRARSKAEVFTPSWICNKQNNLVDNAWVGKENIFNREIGNSWETTTQHIQFPTPSGKTWKDYVLDVRLEISCGEAPYLVSRFDAVSGEKISLERRIGLLDRKMRVVDENTTTYKEWKEWAVKAYQSIYGYDWQGDNVFLARKNLLYTFIDYFTDRFHKEPETDLLFEIAEIISWNIWQMDGLSNKIPVLCENKSCVIKNWVSEKTIAFEDARFFDAVVGNPPYQIMDGGNKSSATPIYNHFVSVSKKLGAQYISMIMPAKWYTGGKGLDAFRNEMLNDRHISKLVDYTDSLDCFQNVDVAGGVCFFLRDESYFGDCECFNIIKGRRTFAKKPLNTHDIFIRYPVADGVIAKVSNQGEDSLQTMVTSRKPFGLPTNCKPENSGDLSLRYNGGIGKFHSDKVPSGKEMISDWKVIVSYLTAEHAGQPDKNGQFRILSTMEVLPPQSICTETYLVAGCFQSEKEAENYDAYLKTKFVRFLIGQVALSQHITKNCFRFVPKQDFSVNWTDEKLYEKYGLSDEEVSFIESIIKPARG